MRTLKLVLPAAVLSFGFFVTTSVSYAKKEYTAKEKVACAKCHVKPAAKDLNAAGKCYGEKKDWKACADAK